MDSLDTFDEHRPRQSPVRPLVVIAIDDEELRAEYAYTLSASGFDVTTTLMWRASFCQKRPDIIVVDVANEDGDGWTFVQDLKRDRSTRDISIVALAPDAGAATCDRARREHCAALCARTCPAGVLASGLRAVLERDVRSS
jgi:CheY-like chemotaxis protein